MLSAIIEFGKMEADAIKKGITSVKIGSLESRKMISKIKWTKEDQVEQLVKDFKNKMQQEFNNILVEVTH
jgi:V/A-type H+-transporting ATPase subunit A